MGAAIDQSADRRSTHAVELHSLNRALLTAGLRPVADIVINHRCAGEQRLEAGWWMLAASSFSPYASGLLPCRLTLQT